MHIMSDPFIGEIRIVAFTFAPRGWIACDGALMAISQFSALFAVLGTAYGGDGRTTFAVPDLRGRAAMQWGGGPGLSPRVIGEVGGTDTVTVLQTQMPMHTHSMIGGSVGAAAAQKVAAPTNTAMFGQSNQGVAYAATATPAAPFSPLAVAVQGGSQPHSNAQPRTALLHCIAIQGIFPPRG
jgi:microcystin-dependent protein